MLLNAKSGRYPDLHKTSQLHTRVIIPLLNSLSLAYHDMRKTWYSGSSVYGAMLEPEYQVFLMDRGKPR